jgi:hypothetical protein
VSLAPSTKRDMAGDGGLLVAEELLLPEVMVFTDSIAPSLLVFLVAGSVTNGVAFSAGVPN